MAQKKFIGKASSVLAMAVTLAPLAGGVLANPAIAHAEDAPKPAVVAKNVAEVSAKATIDDSVAKGNSGNVFAQSYNLNITVPDNVKSGSTVAIKVENLPLLFGSGNINSADVKVDNTVIGKITLTKSVNQRNQQIDTKTSLEQKKGENITAGGGSYEYELVFNDKAEGFKKKDISFKSESAGNVFTAVSKDTTVKAKISVNNKEVASKDVTIKPSPVQDSKVKNSTVDLSTNTQLTNGSDGNIKYFLGLGVRPMDTDYGVGSKITVNLPRDSMMKFNQESGDSKEISVIPAFTSDSFANSSNVYLADVSPVKVKVSEVKDDKLVLEVTEGTMKRVNYYVINSENTPVSFRLTDKAAGKLAADGKSFGPETITSSFTTKDGKSNATDVNTSSIRVNGASMTAKGVQELINKPSVKPGEKKEYITRWIYRDGDKETELKKSFTGDRIQDPDKFNDYVLDKTEQDGNKTTYVYKKTKTLTSRWVEEGKENNDPKDDLKTMVSGEKTEPAGTISGFEFVRTDTDKDGNVKHIFRKTSKEDSKKVKTEYLEEVTDKDKDGKDKVSYKELKPAIIGDKTEPADKYKFDGLTFVRTDKDNEGNVKHIFKRDAAKTPDGKKAVQTGANAGKVILPIAIGGLGIAAVVGAVVLKNKKENKDNDSK